MTQVSLDAVSQAVARARQDAIEVYELCSIAGRTDMAASFVLGGVPLHSVKRQLAQMTDGAPRAGATAVAQASDSLFPLDRVWNERMLMQAPTRAAQTPLALNAKEQPPKVFDPAWIERQLQKPSAL